MPVDLSVVIPAYNEASRLPETLDRVIGYLERRKVDYEILVVNDGSVDATSAVTRDYASRRVWTLDLAINRGKGAALRHGVVASQGARVLLCDADLSTPIEELERLEPLLGEHDLVLGSRSVEGARVEKHQPFLRELLGKGFNLIIRMLRLTSFRDTQCGFKLIKGDVARKLFPELTIDRYAYDVELVVDARRAGYRVVEVGVEWHDSPASRVVPWRDAPQMFFDVLRLRLR